MLKKTPVYDKEATLLHFKANSFINIALVHKCAKPMTDSDKKEMIMDRLHGHVDSIQKKKTKLNFSNVCKCEDGSVAHSVLVEGAPGVGKTTFAFKLCKQWARGEILQEWGVVVIIKLRDQRTRTAQSINDLLYHPDPKLRQAVTELVELNGKDMLLILDGYDELTNKQRESGSIIQWLMSRELLCRATLMVTSRPLATRTLHPNFQQSIDQHIEVLGFTEKNIEEYINSACGDNPELVEDFKEYLSSHPFSSALMFNPLQCAIVTDLYRSHWQCGEKGFAPKTLTELYTGLIHTLLLRYLTHHPEHKDRNWRLRDMSNLPEDVKQQLKAVTTLAAKGIENQQYVFDEEDDNVPSETLGLMQREEELTAGIGRSLSHNFLHLTLQEYLAAVNYSQQCDSPEQLTQLLTRDDLFPLSSFLQYYGKKTKRTIHWPVALFLAGRTQLSGVPLYLLKAGLHDSSVDVSLLHLLYETQCPQLIQSTLVTSNKYISVHGRSALDWFVVGYCIANSTSTWRVEKETSDVLKHFNQLVMGLKLAPQDGSEKGKIVSLDFSGSCFGNFKILSQLQPFAKYVTYTKLVGPKQHVQRNPVSSKGKSNVKEVLDCYTCLDKLLIENVEIVFPYSRFICQPKNLHTLTLKECKLSSEATSSLVQSAHRRPQHKLSLYDCTISTTEYSYQFSSLELQQANTKLCLNATGCSSAINHCLSLLSSYSKLLTDMILCITEQDSSTDETLEGIGLYQQNNLHTLSLKGCKLSSKTTSSLIHSLLSTHCKLHKISLNDCVIFTTDHTYQFCTLTLQVNNSKVSLNATGSCCAINHCLSLLSSYSKLLTVMNLNITKEDSLTDELLEEIDLYHHEQNSLTLSLTKCKLSNEALISSLLFPRCKLQILSLRDCTISTTDYSCQFSFFELQQANAKVSLNATGSYCAMNHWLSQSSSYSTLLTDMILCITEQDSSIDETLEGIGLYEQNNLHTLSLKGCKLSSKITSSLIHSLLSTHCKLHKISLNDCVIFATDHTYQFSTLTLQVNNSKVSLNATGSCCAINHWLSQLSSYSVTELILSITKQEIDETLEGIGLFSHMLDILNINNNHTTCFSFPVPLFLELRQNNLRALSLTKCKLKSEATSLLIHSLLSPDYKLNKLALDECVTSATDHTYQFSFFELQHTKGKLSLTATGSCCAINHWLSQLSSYSVQLAELILSITKQETDETLEGIGLFSHMLEILNINNNHTTCFSFPVPLFLELRQNNLHTLHTLSLTKCKLSSEATSSLIHSLLSPDYKLNKLALDECVTFATDHTYQFSFFEFQNNNDRFSLTATGSCCAINYWLSQLSSYSVLLTELILSITKQETDETLEGISLFSHMLEILNINNNDTTCFSFSLPLFFELHQNNLHTLSLTKCKLSREATSSLIHSLLSPDCRLQKVLLDNCITSTTDHTYQFSFFELEQANDKVLLNATGSCRAINHWLSQLSSYSVLLTELILSITKQETDETLEGISLFSHMLEILNINNNHTTCFSFSIPLFLGLRQNNLHTLSLTKCRLSSEATSSIIHSLLSPDYKLNKLALYECAISFNEHTYTFSAFKVDNCNVSLEAKCFPFAFNHWLSYLSSFSSFSKIMLIELILAFLKHASSNETLESISLYRDVLEVVKIDGTELGSLSSFRFLGQQHNNLHTLSMEWCRFSSKATSSLIHFLQSPHCRLHKLALYHCTIPTTDRTLLTTAIVSSTTITHLFFIDYDIDTPSLTALTSGLKQNRTMEELAVKNFIISKELFQLLIEGVDSSAVKKLWLDTVYMELLSDCPFSRHDVDVELYNSTYGVYKKW